LASDGKAYLSTCFHRHEVFGPGLLVDERWAGLVIENMSRDFGLRTAPIAFGQT